MRKNIGGSHGTAFLLCCLLFVSVVYAEADSGTPLSEARALHLLEARIQQDGLYRDWTTMECLTFAVEGRDRGHFDFAIREEHGGSCPGDPATAPVVDRFRLDRRSHRIQWYDAVDDEWMPYKAVMKARGVQKEASPRDIVQRLYRDFPAGGNKSINSQSREVLSRYFIAGVADLFVKIQECEKEGEGICGPDFMVLYDAQDYQLTEFRIGAFDQRKETVQVSFKNFGRPVVIMYQMDKTPAGWRIADIRYQKGLPLSELLKQ